MHGYYSLIIDILTFLNYYKGIAMIDEQGADGLTMFWIIGIIQVDTTTGRISVVQDRS